MPMRAPSIRPCCGRRLPVGVMCPCQAKRKAEHDAKRPSAAARGYDGKWRTESKAFLTLPQNRYCACGCGRLANVVDHRIPHRGNHRLFWDKRNWQPMSKRCHDSKKQSIERSAPGVVDNFPKTAGDRRLSVPRHFSDLEFPK